MEASCASETSDDSQWTIRHYTTQERTLPQILCFLDCYRKRFDTDLMAVLDSFHPGISNALRNI
jgi:hypothetical protein